MIKVKIVKGSLGHVTEFTVEGHSGYSIHGEDIVCSAVSVLAQTALIGLQDVVGIEATYEIKDGYLKCQMPFVKEKEKMIKANAILDTMVLGLNNIKKNYSSFIQMDIKEEV